MAQARLVLHHEMAQPRLASRRMERRVPHRPLAVAARAPPDELRRLLHGELRLD